jgi:hypothetical protein
MAELSLRTHFYPGPDLCPYFGDRRRRGSEKKVVNVNDYECIFDWVVETRVPTFDGEEADVSHVALAVLLPTPPGNLVPV